MTALLTVLRRTRTLAWTAFSIVIILAAVVVGVGKLLMPYSARYQPQLEAWLSAEFGRPVVLESFSGEWNAFGPRLRLRGMRLETSGEGDTGLTIQEAALDLKPLNALLPGRPWYNFLVIGAELILVEDSGGFQLSGLGSGAGEPAPAPFRNLVGIGELNLEDSDLQYVNPGQGTRLRISRVRARVQLEDESAALSFEGDLVHEADGPVYGEIGGTALIGFSGEGQPLDGRWHVGVQDLMLDALQQRLPDERFLPRDGLLNGEFWGDWLAGRPLVVRGVADLRNARFEHGDGETVIEHANARIGWTFGGRGDWRLDLHQLQFDGEDAAWTAPNLAVARHVDQDIGLWIGADLLPLGVSLDLARDFQSTDERPWPAFLPGSAGGDVTGLDVVLDANWQLRLLRGQVRGAQVEEWGRLPSLSGLDAVLDIQGGQGSVTLHAGDLRVDWPGMFGEVLEFSMPSCRAALDLRDGWQVGLNGCSLINEDIAFGGDFLIVGNTGRPAVDANMRVTRGTIGRLQPYWPEGIMKPRILGWLRRGLEGGQIEEGRVQLRGDMDDWPFREQQGRFEATARVSGGVLAYRPNWPVATGIDAELHFVNTSMDITAHGGSVGGLSVDTARAGISDFKRALLNLDFETDTTVPAMIGFLRESPILAATDFDLDRFVFSGPASARGSIRIPLGTTPGELTVAGDVEVSEAAFEDPAAGVLLERIGGRLKYDRYGVSGDQLDATFRGGAARLALTASTTAVERFRATLNGRFETASLLPDALAGVTAFERIRGVSDWQASVVVPSAERTGGAAPYLVVESTLEGTAIDWPDPLGKPAETADGFKLRYPLSGATRLLEMERGNRSRLALEVVSPEPGPGPESGLASGVQRAGVALGGVPAQLPGAGMLRVTGRPETLDLDGWTDLVTDYLRERAMFGDLKLDQFDLQVGRMQFLDRTFDDVAMALQVGAGEIRADFAANTVDGHVLFTPSARGGSLTAEFERLVLDKPVTGGITMRSNPADLPELHLYARSFRYTGIEMGETRIEAYPTPEGFHFEKVEAESESITLRANGDWQMLEEGPRSDFRILVTTESLGEFLESVDISSSLAGGQTVLRFNAWWPGTPAAFALSRLNGEVEFSVTRGQITNASAGTGRLLGLLSVQALPRRLALDFRDVFDSGFNFEEAHGTFRMENGMASTEDVELSSSAAKISLQGSTDLVAQRYDQVMTVQPGLGNTLPVLGAIAGGPPGAAAGLALQGLLHDELGEATQVRYTITGSWEEPRIEPVLDRAAGAEAATDGP